MTAMTWGGGVSSQEILGALGHDLPLKRLDAQNPLANNPSSQVTTCGEWAIYHFQLISW